MRARKQSQYYDARSSMARFSSTSMLSSCSLASRDRVREREDMRILVRQSCTHATLHRDERFSSVESACGGCSCVIKARRCSRPRMGASDKNDNSTSLIIIAGDAKRDETVCGVGDG